MGQYINLTNALNAVRDIPTAFHAIKKIPIVKTIPITWTLANEALPPNGENVLCWYEYFRYGEYNRMYQTFGIGYQFNGNWGGEVAQGQKAKVLAFGVHRKTLWAWANGIDSDYLPPASRDLIKKAYQFLNAQMEDYAQNGKVNPVTAIFLMKNHFGYADKQEVVLTPNQQLGDQVPAEDLEKKYLEDVVGASSDYDPED